MNSSLKEKKKPDTRPHEELGAHAVAIVPIPTPIETGNLATASGKQAEKDIEELINVDAQRETVREGSLEEALQHTEDAVELDSQAMTALIKESLTGKIETLETTLKKMKAGKGYSKVPQEMKDRIENVAWLTSQARNRLDSMEGPGQENVLLNINEDVSLATFAMSTVPLAKQSPKSRIAKFHEKIKELREMEIEERVAKEKKSYAELRTAATAASLQIRLGANSGSIAFAQGYLRQKAKTHSKEENEKIRKSLELAVQLQKQAEKYLQAGKLGQADALLSKSNTLASATMIYMGALGAKNSMRPPIKGKKQFEKIREDASAKVKKIGAALDGIAALNTSIDAKKLSEQAVQKFNEAREASEAVQKKAAEAELLRFDASREGYVDKRLKRASESARALIDAGKYEDSNELIGIALLYKQTYEKSAFKGAVEKKDKKTTLREKGKQLSKKFKYSLKSDKLRQARKKLRGLLDELVPPAEETKQKPMSESAYERELASAKSLIKSVRRGLKHAQTARKEQDGMLSLAAKQKKKPNSKATDHDIDLMVAYGFMGKEAEAENVLDTNFGEHLDAEREMYAASLNLGERRLLMVEQDKLVVKKRDELAAAGKDLNNQSQKILTNVTLKESYEEIEEREKEEGIEITPQGVSDADRTALAINGGVVGTLETVMKQEAKMASLHDATAELIGGKEGRETGFIGYTVSNILEVQKEEIKKSDEVLREAGGMQAIGRSASTYLIAYRAGESRFWGGGRTLQMRDYIPRAMDKLYDAAGEVRNGRWKDASLKYQEAQGQFMEGFATASERKYDDPLIVEYKEKTQNAFDVLIGKKEGETKDRKAAILALNATNLTVQTQYRGSQVFEGGLENIFVSFEDGGWLNLLGPAGMVAAQIYRATGRSSGKGAAKTREEKLERIGYVPYEERVARLEAETEKVLSGKTSLFEKRGALNNIRNDAADSLETYQVAQSAEDGLFTAASLALQPLFITEMTRDTVRHGADVNTAILAAALAAGKIGQFRGAVSEFAEFVSKGAEQFEKISRLQKIGQHLKDPVTAIHLAATGYLVWHGSAGAVKEFQYASATGDIRHITAGAQSLAFQIPIIAGFSPWGGRASPRAREKSLLGRMREQRAEQKFREKLEKARPKEQRELEKRLKVKPEAPTGEKVKEAREREGLRKVREEREWRKLATEERGVVGPEARARSLEGKVRPAREVEAEAVEARAVEEAAPKEEAKSETREEKQVASFIKRYSVEWAEKTISENRPGINETAKNRELRELALNRIAKEPVEVRTRLKEKIMKNTPKELRDSMEIEWKVYVEGMIHGANKYSPIKEIGFKPIQDKLAPETTQDIADFLRAVSVEGPNAHGVKGGHGRFTGIIVTGQLHAGAYVGPLKKMLGGNRSLSAVGSGPFWIILGETAGSKKGPITAKEHVAYVCPSEKYMMESSKAIKDAYSQGMLSRTEAVGALSKLMSAAEAKEAPATSFRSQAKQNAIAKRFWTGRTALGEAEIASFERFSGMEVKKVAAKPKKNIVEKIEDLRAKEKETGRPSIERARLERLIEQNPHLKEEVENFKRTERVLKRAMGKEYGVVGDVKGARKQKISKAEKAKAEAKEKLAEAEATAKAAKPAKAAELSPGRKRAAKALDKIKRAKQRMLELGRRPKERMEIRREERAAQVLTPDGRKRVEVPQEQAGNPTRRVQDTIFKTAIPDVGMRNAIGLERGRALAENAWAEVYKGEAKPAFRTVLEKDAYVVMKEKVQERFDQVVDYAWRDTIREKTKLIKGTKKPSRVNEAEVVVYLRMKKIFNTIWEANIKRKGMNKKSVEKMIKPQELAADYRGYLQRGAGMPKEMLAKVKEMGIETTIPFDKKFVTKVKNSSGDMVFGDLHGDHICPVTALKEVGFVIDTRPDLAVSDTSVLPKDRYIKNKEIPPGTQFIFLGDYIDRGPHSLYTVDFVQWFKAEVGALENGSHVHTIRGNHEAIFTRVFNKYKNKSTADVKGLIEQIETHRTLMEEGKKMEAKKLLDSGRLGEFRKEGLWLERVGTETLLKEILDKYGTWENAVVEMQKEGGLMHFIENTKAAVIVDNHLYVHGGPVTNIKNVEDFNRYFEDFFKNDLNSWSQNAPPTDPKMYEKYEQNARSERKGGDYSSQYGSFPENKGGWKPNSETSTVGKELESLAENLGLWEGAVHNGHDRRGNVGEITSLNFGNGKSFTIINHDSSLSGAYISKINNWQGGITYSTPWGVLGKKDVVIYGRKDKVVEMPSDIRTFDSSMLERKNQYTEAWEQTTEAKLAATEDITVPVPTVRVPVPAMAPPAPKVAVPKAPITQKPAGIMPKRPTQPVPGGKRVGAAKQIAQAKAVKKGYQEMPENITKWVDPETGLPWSKLVEYMENGNYSKTFTIPVEIKGKTGEWIVTIEGATRVTGQEMYWYTVSSSPANINYRPGQTTGAVVLQKGANLKHLITKNIQRSVETTSSPKKAGATKLPKAAPKKKGGTQLVKLVPKEKRTETKVVKGKGIKAENYEGNNVAMQSKDGILVYDYEYLLGKHGEGREAAGSKLGNVKTPEQLAELLRKNVDMETLAKTEGVTRIANVEAGEVTGTDSMVEITSIKRGGKEVGVGSELKEGIDYEATVKDANGVEHPAIVRYEVVRPGSPDGKFAPTMQAVAYTLAKPPASTKMNVVIGKIDLADARAEWVNTPALKKRLGNKAVEGAKGIYSIFTIFPGKYAPAADARNGPLQDATVGMTGLEFWNGRKASGGKPKVNRHALMKKPTGEIAERLGGKKVEAEAWPRARALEAEKELILADLDKAISTKGESGAPVPQGRVIEIKTIKPDKVFKCKIRTKDGKETDVIYTTTDFRQQEIGLTMYEVIGEKALGHVSLDGKRAVQESVGAMDLKDALPKATPKERQELFKLLGRQGVIDYALGVPDAHGENYRVQKTDKGWELTRIDLENSGLGWGKQGRHHLDYYHKFAYNLKTGLKIGKYAPGDIKAFVEGLREGVKVVKRMNGKKIMDAVAKYEGTPLKQEGVEFTGEMRENIGKRILEIQSNPEKVVHIMEGSISAHVKDVFIDGLKQGKTNLGDNKFVMEWMEVLEGEVPKAGLNALIEWKRDLNTMFKLSEGKPPERITRIESKINEIIKSKLKGKLSKADMQALINWKEKVPIAEGMTDLLQWKQGVKSLLELSKEHPVLKDIETDLNVRIVRELGEGVPADINKLIRGREEAAEIARGTTGELSDSAREVNVKYAKEILRISREKFQKSDPQTLNKMRDAAQDITKTAEGELAASAKALDADITTRILEGAGKRALKKEAKGKKYAAEKKVILAEIENAPTSTLETLRDSFKSSEYAEKFADEVALIEKELSSRKG